MPISLGTTTITALFLGTTSITSAYLGNTQVFGGSFTPLSLFSGGAQGIWLDPSDLSTMFVDRAGTTPVTTPGTVVGKRLDKSGRGNHATAPTDAARPTYGVEPKGGRRNLLTWSEDFGNAAWLKGNATVPATQYLAPDGTTTAELMYPTANGGNSLIYRTDPAASRPQFLSYFVKPAGKSWVAIGTSTDAPNLAYFNLSGAGSVGAVGANLETPVITAVAEGFYRISVRAKITAVGVAPTAIFVCDGDGSTTIAASGTSGILIWGAQLETGSTATNYQRVTTAYDVTESGVPSCHYVQYDGSDDSMSTAAIDFTATDKMSVFAGVRKLSDATLGIVAELSSASTNPGAFSAIAPTATSAANYRFGSGGSLTATAVSSGSYAAPTSNILTGLGDISGDLVTLRLDGTQVAQSTTNQGTGNYGNYSMFFGRRNNAGTTCFNGRDYGIIVVGKAASAGEITDTETWLAARTSGVSI